MLSKEEIEKAKGWLLALDIKSEFEAISKEILLQYIEELETSNAELDKENNRLEKIEFERDKQNKIIDLMAEEINKATSEKYKIKTICEKGKCQNEECHEDDWTKCIKQYFEKKVEEK